MEVLKSIRLASIWELFFVSIVTVKRWVGFGAILAFLPIHIHPVSAQRIRDIPERTAQIYELLPDLPLEDSYVSLNGEVMANSSWVQRILLYHIQTKGRLPNSRFDWRMTFADFLGANLPMYTNQYPGADIFAQNPLNGDRDLFQTLTRQERNQLLAAFLQVYGNNSVANSLELAHRDRASTSTSATVDRPESQTDNELHPNALDGDDVESTSGTPTIDVHDSQPGDADLLRP